MKLEASFKPQKISVSVSAPSFCADIETPVAREYVNADPYTGDYAITPAAEPIVLQTHNKRMTANLTINPIPQNYGRIEWDGAVMLIS